jgi:antitoxin MazE9
MVARISTGMKVSVSLPDDDVEFLDEYAARQQAPSRSAVIHEAVRLLREIALEAEYGEAWDEWVTSGEAAVWDATTGDGLDASR